MLLRLAWPLLFAFPATACSSPATVSTGDGLSGASLSCAQRKAEGGNLIEAAFTAAGVTQCQTDTDCLLQDTSTRCAATCGGVPVSKGGAGTLEAAVAKADALCGTGCDEAPLPCALGPRFAACSGGTCTASTTAPAGWVSFAMEQAGAAGAAVPLSCATGASCTLWTLTPDGTVSVSKSGVAHQAKLSAADFQTVNGILQGADFRQHASGTPWPCDGAATNPFVSVNVAYTTLTLGMDVTLCVKNGPAGNGPQQLFQVLSAY